MASIIIIDLIVVITRKNTFNNVKYMRTISYKDMVRDQITRIRQVALVDLILVNLAGDLILS